MSTNLMKRAMVVGVLGTLFVVAAGCTSEVVGGDELKSGTGDSGGSSTDACWDFGPDAPGECKVGDERECPTEDGGTGGGASWPQNFCREKCVNIDGKAVWGATTHDFECPFYETPWHRNGGIQCECNTPLVLSFDDRPVTFTAEAGRAFDLTHDGVCHASDWPTAATPWLALDRDGDGAINDGGELFGSATRLTSGAFAKNGFEALRDLDADGNGVFDARDPAFAKVVVWTDRNLDRQSSPGELSSLEAAGVTSIDLRDHRETRCDARGNCEGERSDLAFIDASGMARRGAVIDVYLPTR